MESHNIIGFWKTTNNLFLYIFSLLQVVEIEESFIFRFSF